MAIDITVRTGIALPVHEVAEYVLDPANEPKWISGISTSEPLMPGPVAVGSHVKRRAKFAGRKIEYMTEVVALDEDARVLMKTDKPFPMTIEYQFADAEGGTVFTQRLQGGPGGVVGVLSPLMAIMVKNMVKRDMQRLKRILEGRLT
jgi:hypothetical protein